MTDISELHNQTQKINIGCSYVLAVLLVTRKFAAGNIQSDASVTQKAALVY